MRAVVLWFSAVPIALATAGACGTGADVVAPPPTQPATTATQPATTATQPATTTTAGSLPTAEEMMAVLLTPAEVGAGFVGNPPVVGQRSEVLASPICGVTGDQSKKDLASVSVAIFSSQPGPQDQVFERLSVESDPENPLDVTRRTGEARCQFREAGGLKPYTVKVNGPVDLSGIGDAATGFSETFSSGYDRWVMVARKGRIVVNVQYTSPSPIKPARAKSLLVAAVDKASSLR